MSEQETVKKIVDMTMKDLIYALNISHNIIHECDEKKLKSAQDINNLMAEIEKREDDTRVQDSVS